jgi:asparagine synthase (glutamine-hydrolysing)
MCGILGGISIAPIDWLAGDEPLAGAIDSLAHRGPDDRGRYVSTDRRSFLGFRRLSIIDLTGGHQPIANETGRVRICCNGEIYNFRRLREELTARGHKFTTQSDAETVLHSYEDDPRSFVERLSGMFAISILDEERKTLTLARDRNGIKPLYYFHDGRTLIFASELKVILELLPRPEIDRQSLGEYLRWKYVPSPKTIYRNIYKLPPAHTLRASYDTDAKSLQLDLRKYWEIDYGGEKITDEREAIELLDQTVRRAVESHLESDVEVGALLSGGVDSSLVVALASILSGKRIKTFSVGFEETGFDQLPFARVVAEKYGTDHYEEHVRLDPMQMVPKLVRQFDEPFADSSALACYRVCEVAAKHVKVALTGDGGDETFAGYGRYQEVIDFGTGPGTLTQLRNKAVMLSSGLLFSPEAKYLKRFQMADSPLTQHKQHQYLCSPFLINKLLGGESLAGPDGFDIHLARARSRGWPPVEVAQYVDLNMYLPDDILTKVDRTSMACSLECRVPLLDHSVTELSTRIPTEMKVRNGVRKYLLKKVAEKYVPPELLYRQKMGFRVPIRRWFKRDLLEQTRTLMLDGALVSRGLIRRDGLEWVFKAQRRPWIDLGSQLWALLMLEHWAREHG